jgi:hypothetical protein
MAFQSDDQGFLQGLGNSQSVAAYGRQLEVLRAINAGIESIDRKLDIQNKASSGVSPADPRRSRGSGVPVPASNEAGIGASRNSLSRPSDITQGSPDSKRQPSAPAVPRKSREALTERGANGRFKSKGGSPDKKKSPKDDDGDDVDNRRAPRHSAGRLASAVESMKGGLSGITSGSERIDPTIAAGKEIKDALSPLMKPVKSLLGGMFSRGGATDEEKAERKVSVPWYRRIWSELREGNKKNGGGGGGLMGALMGALAALPSLLGGKLSGLLKHIPGAGFVGGVMRRGGSLIGSIARRAKNLVGRLFGRNAAGSEAGAAAKGGRWGRIGRLGSKVGNFLGKVGKYSGLSKVAKLGGGLLKRIPMLGNLITAVTGMASILDPNATKEEKFHGGGSAVGALAGGALGSLLGPIGTVLGGMLGEKVGGMVGDWLATLDWSKIGEKISGAWDNVVNVFSDAGKLASDAASAVFKSISDAGSKLSSMVSDVYSSVKNWLGDKFGGMVEGAKDLAKSAVDTAKSTASYVGDKAGSAYTAAKEAVSSAATKVSDGFSSAKDAAVVQGGRLLGSLDSSYRHKESFGGIAGGSALGTYGSYTNDEASRIRELKQGGYNTSANVKGGMSAATQKKITDAAIARGLDPREMLAMAAMESGGNSNAISSTGAIGTYQFTGRTATGVGITNRFDEDQNIAGGMKLALTNQQYLKSRGLPVTAANLYMMHQLGPSSAEELILGQKNGKKISDLSASTQAAVKLNYGSGSTTADEYITKNAKALDSRYASVVGGASGNSSPSPLVTGATPGAPGSTALSVPPLLQPMSANNPMAVASSNAAPTVTNKAPSTAATPPEKIASDASKTVGVMRMEQPVGQDVSERQIAALVTGGIGNQGGTY